MGEWFVMPGWGLVFAAWAVTAGVGALFIAFAALLGWYARSRRSVDRGRD